MWGESHLDKLGRCAGYSVKNVDGTPVVLFQEHRMAIPSFWAANRDSLFPSRPMLVRIDAHTDYAEEAQFNYARVRDLITDTYSCISFANSLNPDDGGWVEAAIKYNWVGDCINLFVQCAGWQVPHGGTAQDLDGGAHEIIALGDLAAATGDDEEGVAVRNRQLGILQRLGICDCGTAAQSQTPIWLDIDLDFAVPEVHRRNSRPRSPDQLREWLENPVAACPDAGESGLTVIDRLLEAADLITIATEPEFTGGFSGVATVLRGLRHCFPEHAQVFSWFGEED